MAKYRYSRSILLEMARIIEESAKYFYLALSRKFPDHKDLFEQLARDEESHAETYAHLLFREEMYSTEEERLYGEHNIKILEDVGVIDLLRKGATIAREVSDLKSALDAAVQSEKDAMLFYYAISMGLGKADEEEINKIIRMEHDHLYKVQQLSI